MSQSRREAILSTVERQSRIVAHPVKDGRKLFPSEIFAENVFTMKALEKALPKPIYASFIKQVKGRQQLDRPTADAIAHAVRVWAMERGANYFTHWFQPQTDSTAEKHDSFLSLKSTFSPAGETISPIDAFSGSQLLQSEPDASSFPSGGMRTTFEARGYTVWDTTSPMFLQTGPHDLTILYIPSIFISYNGDALDEKTVLLRSNEVISKAAVELLNLIDPVPSGSPPFVNHVFTTLGTEQEFFLIDRSLYALRPDLKICGRSLLGSLPPRHQQMEDHYFGKIPSRVLAAINEVEIELYKVGVPMKTHHNEVAPAQFEMAPIFEEAMVAVDHNLLTMDTIHKVAHRHKLKALFHEKPFKGVNGSGKHCNWSISTDRGDNLLDPTVKPETNYRFLLFLVAVLHAVHRYGGLLRAAIASASNDHRLGANEAPPGIISVFLGEHLTEVLNSIEESRPVKSFSQTHIQTIKLGGTVLDVKVSSLPSIARDLTDRNRTSPFAFTGNKFEFRAVGAKQSPSFPVTLLNSAVASAILDVTQALIEQKGSKDHPSDADKLEVIKKFIVSSKSIRFEGDNYSEAWVNEAEKRGLPNIKNSHDAFKLLKVPDNREMLVKKVGVFSDSELNSRYHILVEKYIKDILIEANTLKSLIYTYVIPAALEYRGMLAQSAANLQRFENISFNAEEKLLQTLGSLVESAQKDISLLEDAIEKCNEEEDHDSQAKLALDLLPIMEKVREHSDALEGYVSDKLWPLPKYTELLFQI